MNEEVKSRKCNVCGLEKPTSELVASKKYFGGFMPLCKPCRNTYWKRRRDTVPGEKRKAVDRVRKSRVLHQHGVSHDDYQRMLRVSGDRCQLCGTSDCGRDKAKFRVWNIDHCHGTGRVRGLLCHTCNIGLGHIENFIAKIGLEKIEIYLGRRISDGGGCLDGRQHDSQAEPGPPP